MDEQDFNDMQRSGVMERVKEEAVENGMGRRGQDSFRTSSRKARQKIDRTIYDLDKVEAQRERADEAEESLRDRLAAKVMECVLQDYDALCKKEEFVSLRAYGLADAMMAARSVDLDLPGVELEVVEENHE